MTHDIPRTADYRDSIRSLKQKVQSAQIKTARAVNTRLMGLYRDLGKLIAEKQRAAGRGDAVIEQIDHDLTRELGGVNGFSRRNLYRINQSYSFYADQDDVLAHQIDTRRFERRGAKTGIDSFSERLPIPDSDLARREPEGPLYLRLSWRGRGGRGTGLERGPDRASDPHHAGVRQGLCFRLDAEKINANNP